MLTNPKLSVFKYCARARSTIYTKNISEILLIIIIPKTIKIQRKEKKYYLSSGEHSKLIL